MRTQINNPTHRKASYSDWRVYHENAPMGMYPTESILDLSCGSFIPGFQEKLIRDGFEDAESLDVSFGNGVNLSLLGRLGVQLSGLDVGKKLWESAALICLAGAMKPICG